MASAEIVGVVEREGDTNSKQQVARAMLDEYDEESPLESPSGHRSSDQNGDSNQSPPPETVTAMPLIILPVQSEGIPTSGGFPMGRGNPASPAVPLLGEELRKVLTQQLEYYFSKDNLSSDKYLLSQMDGDNYVPVSVISNFNQVKKLSTDMTLILEALKDSSVLQLDETGEKVRAIPEKRCVLILREIPKDTPKEEIVSLFAHKNCPSCVTCEFADNNCWYVTFDSEESTQKAFAYLREQVREFLGQPIRARIKGTTVQRSSGMPKTKQHVPFSMQPMYNGGPSQLPYFSAPPSSVMPWSPTPPTSSASPYFDPSNFSPFMGNGFTPPQQTPPSQVGTQSPAAMGATGGGGTVQPVIPTAFNGGVRYVGAGGSFPYVPIMRTEGDRGGRGNRMGPPNRPHRGDRAQSPPAANEGEPPGSDRDKGGRGGVGVATGGSGMGGGGGGGRYRGHVPDDRKMGPRLKNTRHGGRVGGVAGEGERPAEKNVPPRQQPKPQPKLDLATAHFPPLPNSSSTENGTAPTSAPPTTSTSHTSAATTSEDGPKTLSDIVKGGTRSLTKETGGTGPTPNPAPSSSSSSSSSSTAAVASSVVEKSIASAAAKLSQTTATTSFATAISTSPPSNSQDIAPPRTTSHSTVNSDPSTSQAARTDMQARTSALETPSSGGGVAGDGTVVSTARPVTVSSVVASGGAGPQQSSGQGGRAPPPPPLAPSTKKFESKPFPPKDKQYYGNGNSKTYNRYPDRGDLASSKHNRNSQVSKSDGRSAATSNIRSNRYKERDYFPPPRNGSSSTGNIRPSNNNSRQNHVKSPKTFKKNFPSQAPPPPPGPAHSPVDESNQGSGSGAEVSPPHSQSAAPSKPEKLSYAQMAQKSHNQSTKSSSTPESTSAEGVAKAASTPISPLTTPPAPPQSTSKSINSSSTGSLATGQGQSSGPAVSRSAPTSPTKESGGASGERGQMKSKENEV